MKKLSPKLRWLIIVLGSLVLVGIIFVVLKYTILSPRPNIAKPEAIKNEELKEYKNETYGFALSYPKTWEAKETTQNFSGAVFTINFAIKTDQNTSTPYPNNLFVRVWPNYENLSLENWLTARYKKPGTESTNYKPGQTIELGSQKGLASSSMCCTDYDFSYTAASNQFIYEFGTNNGAEKITTTSPEVKDLDNKVLLRYGPYFKFIPVKTLKTNISSDSITDKWPIYEDDKFRLSFRYPLDWLTPAVTEVRKDPALPTSLFNYSSLNFGAASDKIKKVSLSGYETYIGTPRENDLNKIKKVYLDKDPKGLGGLWLPPADAAIFAPSTSYYIETYDKKWRGIYYFASIGQAFNTNLNLIVILTDGIGKIFQLQISDDSFRKMEFEARNLEKEETKNDFFSYVKSLSNTYTDEPLIKNFNENYKYIILNLKSF